MGYTSAQIFVTTKDPEIQVATTSDIYPVKQWICITHESFPLEVYLHVFIDDVEVEYGEAYSGDPYELKRISITQTVIKINAVYTEPHKMTLPDLSIINPTLGGIGYMQIDTTFVVK